MYVAGSTVLDSAWTVHDTAEAAAAAGEVVRAVLVNPAWPRRVVAERIAADIDLPSRDENDLSFLTGSVTGMVTVWVMVRRGPGNIETAQDAFPGAHFGESWGPEGRDAVSVAAPLQRGTLPTVHLLRTLRDLYRRGVLATDEYGLLADFSTGSQTSDRTLYACDVCCDVYFDGEDKPSTGTCVDCLAVSQ